MNLTPSDTPMTDEIVGTRETPKLWFDKEMYEKLITLCRELERDNADLEQIVRESGYHQIYP